VSTRITQSMISRNVLADINTVSDRLERTRQKLASGKELTRPSDDPLLVGRDLMYRSQLASNRQYQRNIDEAQGWHDASDSALASIGRMLLRARDLAVSGANGATDAASRQAMAAEINQIIDGIKNEGNAQYAGRYLFAGTSTLTAPYATADDAYHGDPNAIQREIGPGVQLQVNTIGSDVVGDAASGIVKALRDLHASLVANDVTAISNGIRSIDTAHDALITARADIGSRSNRLEAAQGRLGELEESTMGLLSKTEDADMAKTYVEASTQQAVYQSALQAGAKIVQTSLLDFLR
jgi:flagellar hook-associated protein 3 FlgL